MKKYLLIIVSVFIAAISQTPASFAAPAGAEKDIRALMDRFAAGMKAKDVNQIMSIYSPGKDLVVFDVIPPRQYVGAEAYRKDFEDLFKIFAGPVDTCEINDLAIVVDKKMAYSHSIQHIIFTDNEGKKTEFNVRVTDVFQKSGRKWMIVHEHVSWPVDPMTGKADMMSRP
jgi:uncharacterized protein (TIGR02246 family)